MSAADDAPTPARRSSDLFARSSATGGLATAPSRARRPGAVTARHEPVARLRQGVELTEADVDFLRSLSRPARTGQPRTLGSKFVATGVLAAAIELLQRRHRHGRRPGRRPRRDDRPRCALRSAGAATRPSEGRADRRRALDGASGASGLASASERGVQARRAETPTHRRDERRPCSTRLTPSEPRPQAMIATAASDAGAAPAASGLTVT